MKTIKKYIPDEYISVKDYAATQTNRRGYPLSESYVYRMIKEHKAGTRETLDFDYIEIGQIIRIKK